MAWLLHKGEDIIPIPGTRSAEHLLEDLGGASVTLSADLMARLEAVFQPEAIVGQRYNKLNQSQVDTEMFPGDAHPA
jgi:aryl-alcohol dehydrogenase-like predicted oxidoreductase